MATKTKPMTLVIEPTMKRKLEELAKQQDVSVSQIVRQAVRSYLEAQSLKTEAA